MNAFELNALDVVMTLKLNAFLVLADGQIHTKPFSNGL